MRMGGGQYNPPPPRPNLPLENTLCGVRAGGGESVGAFAGRFARGGEGSVGRFAALYCAQFFKYLQPAFLVPRLISSLLSLPGEDLATVVEALQKGGGGGMKELGEDERGAGWLYDEERGYALREDRAWELLEGLGVLGVRGREVVLPHLPPPLPLGPPPHPLPSAPGALIRPPLREVPRDWIAEVRVAGGANRGAERAENLLGRGVEGWNKWLHPGGGGGSWIEVGFTHPLPIVAYAIQSANDVPDRDPKGWRVLTAAGAGDGGAGGGGWVERHRVGEESCPFSARWQWLQWGLSEQGSSGGGEGGVTKVRIEFTGARQQWGSDGNNLQVGHVAFFTTGDERTGSL